MSEVEGQVRQVAADLLGVQPDELTADSSTETVAAWDSVRHLNLVLALEQQFGIEFDPEEIEGMTSVGAIVAAVTPRVDGRGSDGA